MNHVVGRESEAVEARRQETIVALDRRIAEARAAEDDGDYAKAIRKYEEILNILNWYKYQADFPITTEQARALLDRAREQQVLYEQRNRADTQGKILAEEKARQDAARDQELRQMRVFLQMASDAYDRGEYDLAQANAEKVLALDPRNESAKELIRIAKETKYVADRQQIREQFNDEWKTIMEQLEYDALPHPDVMRFPENWSEIATRRPKETGSRAVSAPDPRTEQILNTLAQKRVYDLSFDGGTVRVDAAKSGRTIYSIIENGSQFEAMVEERGAHGFDILVSGRLFHLEAVDERSKVLAQQARTLAEGPQSVAAHMPGKVVKLHVAVGARVAEGQGVVVVEAMKMENELRAAREGRVAAVHVRAGQAVEKGAPLVTLESVEPSG